MAAVIGHFTIEAELFVRLQGGQEPTSIGTMPVTVDVVARDNHSPATMHTALATSLREFADQLDATATA